MKRLHVHVAVPDLEQAIGYYTAILGSPPTRRKPDYAKWHLDDPRVNFAISVRSGEAGLRHLGIQVDGEEELDLLRARVRHAGASAMDEGKTECCYARSDKSWLRDPAGLSWELFHTFEELEDEAAGIVPSAPEQAERCCAPTAGRDTRCCGT